MKNATKTVKYVVYRGYFGNNSIRNQSHQTYTNLESALEAMYDARNTYEALHGRDWRYDLIRIEKVTTEVLDY